MGLCEFKAFLGLKLGFLRVISFYLSAEDDCNSFFYYISAVHFNELRII